MTDEVKTTRHELRKCPACGYELDTSNSLSGASQGPGPGDVTVCIDCGVLLEFGEGMEYVLLEDEELKRKNFAPGERENLRQIVETIREMVTKRKMVERHTSN